MKNIPPITLLTDFNIKDAYVSSMKGVILNICPQARIVDISHAVPRFDVRHGAFLLLQAAPYFPEGTIHIAVVDPGVGTMRHHLLIETSRYIFIGPDNGVLTLAAANEGIKRVFKIENDEYTLPSISKTFAGRDIFAPVAGYVAKGVPLEEFGPELRSFQMLRMPDPKTTGEYIAGEVFLIDAFGNLITNIPFSQIKNTFVYGLHIRVKIKRVIELPFVSTYGDVNVGDPLITVGSSNFLEIGINQGDASKRFKATTGDPILFFRPSH